MAIVVSPLRWAKSLKNFSYPDQIKFIVFQSGSPSSCLMLFEIPKRTCLVSQFRCWICSINIGMNQLFIHLFSLLKFNWISISWFQSAKACSFCSRSRMYEADFHRSHIIAIQSTSELCDSLCLLKSDLHLSCRKSWLLLRSLSHLSIMHLNWLP